MRPPSNNKAERAVLFALYESPDGLNVSELGEHTESKYAETLEATEQLIARGYVRGKRQKALDGSIYFDKLKLTPSGERVALKEKHAARTFDVTVTDVGGRIIERFQSKGTLD